MVSFGLDDVIAEDLVLRDLHRCSENIVVDSPEQEPRSFSEQCRSSFKTCFDCTWLRVCERRSQEPNEELTVDTRSEIIETFEFYAGPLIFHG